MGLVTLKDLAKRVLPESLVRKARTWKRKTVRRLERARLGAKGMRFTVKDLSNDLKALGVSRGDLLVVYSSLSKMGNVAEGAEAVVDSLLEAIGPSGTLVMPAFNVSRGMLAQIRSGIVFDPRTTPTSLGIINETFRRRPGVKRSVHPTHSLAAFGPLAEEITRDHEKAETTFGRGSPFVRLLERDALLIGLGVSLHVITYYHTFEDLHEDYPIRTYLPKPLEASYIGEDGVQHTMKIRVHDPSLAPFRIDHLQEIQQRFMEFFRDARIIRAGKAGMADSWTVRSQDAYKLLEELLRKGITIYSESVMASNQRFSQTAR